MRLRVKKVAKPSTSSADSWCGDSRGSKFDEMMTATKYTERWRRYPATVATLGRILMAACLAGSLAVAAPQDPQPTPQDPPVEDPEISKEEIEEVFQEALDRLRDRHYTEEDPPNSAAHFDEAVRSTLYIDQKGSLGGLAGINTGFPNGQNQPRELLMITVSIPALRSGDLAKSLTRQDLLVELLDHIFEHEYNNMPAADGGRDLPDDPPDPSQPTPIEEVSNVWGSVVAAYKVVLQEQLKPAEEKDECRSRLFFAFMEYNAKTIADKYIDEIKGYTENPTPPAPPFGIPSVDEGGEVETNPLYEVDPEDTESINNPLPFEEATA